MGKDNTMGSGERKHPPPTWGPVLAAPTEVHRPPYPSSWKRSCCHRHVIMILPLKQQSLARPLGPLHAALEASLLYLMFTQRVGSIRSKTADTSVHTHNSGGVMCERALGFFYLFMSGNADSAFWARHSSHKCTTWKTLPTRSSLCVVACNLPSVLAPPKVVQWVNEWPNTLPSINQLNISGLLNFDLIYSLIIFIHTQAFPVLSAE